MKKLIKFAALAALLLPAIASAQQVLTLRGAPTDADGRVTVGDVFDNAGPLANVVLGYRTGPSVILDAATVQSVVGANGGYWDNPRGQRRIVVTAGADGGYTPVAVAAIRPAQPENPFARSAAPAYRPAMAGDPSRGPVVVHRLEMVEVTWSAGGVSLTMSGIAQKDAAAGETVSIQNPSSKKMIDAVITGPGHGIAGPGADSYRTLQLSSR
jgi:flagella basal body P-ring formation protein FlgA